MKNIKIRWGLIIVLVIAVLALLFVAGVVSVTFLNRDGGVHILATDTPEPTATLKPTATKTPMPTATSTPKPTSTPRPTATRKPTVAPTEDTCSLDASFVADVNVHDGTVMEPGQSFEKTWRISNSGDCEWPSASRPMYQSGVNLRRSGTHGTYDGVLPEETKDVTVQMVAPPANGLYKSVWQMCSGDTCFGDTFYVLIRVGAEPTAQPQATTVPATAVPVPPTEAPQPTAAPVCECGYDAYNCSDFGSHAAAQACYEYCVSQGMGNIHHLDGNDNDGIACEGLK